MTYTIVQTKQAYAGASATTHSITLDAAATAGNMLLVILFGDKNMGTINTPTTSGVTPLTVIQQANLTSVSGGMAYKVANGGETTITWTWTTSRESCLYVFEISGLTSSPYDVSAMTASGDTAGKTKSTGTTATTAQADELAVAVMMADTQDNCSGGRSWSNSFTEYAHVNSTSREGGSIATKTLSATGTVETTFTTTSTGDQMMAIVATFKIAAAVVNTSGLLAMF